MSTTRKIHFDKLYSFDRIGEVISIGLPFKKGELTSPGDIIISDSEGRTMLSQAHTLSRYDDNSIKYALCYFKADLPANKEADYSYSIGKSEASSEEAIIEQKDGEFFINTGSIHLQLNKNYKTGIGLISYNKRYFGEKEFEGPILTDKYGKTYTNRTDNIEIIYNGPVCAVLSIDGTHMYNDDAYYNYNITLTFFKDKSYFDIKYRVTNSMDSYLQIQSLFFKYKPGEILDDMKVMTGISNYKTKLTKSTVKDKLEHEINAETIKYESSEHFPEVFLGTFYGDMCDEYGGMCATIYQAKQNFPKSVLLNRDGFTINLVPKGSNKIQLQPGMAKSQRLLIHFHEADITDEELDNISTLYQMPDTGILSKETYIETGLYADFLSKREYDIIDETLIDMADSHGRALGIMSFGDYPDMAYTNQGRAGDNLVWANNEYDFPHACMLLFIKTGQRRFLDYMKVSALHQMEVDICHANNDPLLLGGQWMHCQGHTMNSEIVCSHQWVEGLLDYYHVTGDPYALESAIGIGNNIKRLLETDKYATPGKSNARETGWALRTLTALYQETYNKSWLERCDWIVSNFTEWKDKYGGWLAPYTDNTLIRVPFMISVAIGSLYRYYKLKPSDNIKTMIIDAMDDLCTHAMLPNGLFYYKELPSLSRNNTNSLVLEALAICYELTQDTKYLKKGLKTLRVITSRSTYTHMGNRSVIEDALLFDGQSPKKFAQAMIPLSRFAQYCEDEGLLTNE